MLLRNCLAQVRGMQMIDIPMPTRVSTRSYTLHLNVRPGYVIGRWPPPINEQCELQYRIDMAREYGVEPDEGYFYVWEDGVVINKLDIPR